MLTHLAKIYPKLRERLEREGRLAWVSEEMANLASPANYDTDPENAWKRLKPRKFSAKYLAAFRAVAAWRERTAQNRDQPRGRILKDEAIDEIATQLPTDADGLNRLRSVPKGFSARASSRTCRRGHQGRAEGPRRLRPRDRPPRRPRPAAPRRGGRAAEGAAQGLGPRTRAWPSKLIATVADLEKIAGDDKAPVQALQGWRPRPLRRGRPEAQARRAGPGARRRAGAGGRGLGGGHGLRPSRRPKLGL